MNEKKFKTGYFSILFILSQPACNLHINRLHKANNANF